MESGYELLKDADAKSGFHTLGIANTNGRRLLTTALAAIATLALSLYILSPTIEVTFGDKDPHSQSSNLASLDTELKQCATSTPPPANPPAPVNLWA